MINLPPMALVTIAAFLSAFVIMSFLLAKLCALMIPDRPVWSITALCALPGPGAICLLGWIFSGMSLLDWFVSRPPRAFISPLLIGLLGAFVAWSVLKGVSKAPEPDTFR
jgi:hypothetical protein